MCRSITDISLLDREEKAMFIKIRENYAKKKLHAERESYVKKSKATWRRRKLRVERESYADKNKATWRRRKLRGEGKKVRAQSKEAHTWGVDSVSLPRANKCAPPPKTDQRDCIWR